MIEIRNISFRYSVNPVLKEVSSHIYAGDFVALVGPNGSGKSTLIRCINGILKPQEGAILIDGRPVNDYSPNALARKVAYVPQSIRRYQSTTVFDTVLMGRKPYISWKPASTDLEISADILRRLNLGHLSMKRTNELSGGQQQTVMIARALAQEPKILLLDEPTANLDIKHQLEVLELLQTLSGKGICVLIAIHDINLAVRYASHIMMLKEGSIFAYGNREVVTEQNIERLYDVEVEIIHRNNHLYIVPGGLLKE